ncbi:histidine phosphatase family protein [Lactobacillus sp. PV037]|uniref:histidine phosphatase family protein n=1 Tax=Lactobacillus sp. PV037 TaxID=2594496 RepID=UPI00223F5D24|nr:histidine phosphatase family protein [Lactobacillus sp. PV037]QNQ83058.1 histidine phosphatase family protein [Lactobacillus sp. PV037]
MEVVILRHGETELNAQGKVQGARVDPSLSKRGREDAENAAKNFDASLFDAIYVSPLQRAQETAKIFVGERSYQVDDRIKEFDFGSWDEQPVSYLKDKYPDAFDKNGFTNTNMYKYAKDIESKEHFEKRLVSFMNELVQKHRSGKILIVCHGVVSRMICAHYISKGDMTSFAQMGNCCACKLYLDEQKQSLVFYNKYYA